MDEQSEGEHVLTVRLVLCVILFVPDCHGALQQDPVTVCVCAALLVCVCLLHWFVLLCSSMVEWSSGLC